MLSWVFFYLLIASLADEDKIASLFQTVNISGSSVQMYKWCGSKNTLLLLTQEGEVYRSANDDELKFTQITKKLTKAAKGKANEDEEIGRANSIEIYKSKSDIAIIYGTEGINWISHDCGAKWEVIKSERQLESVKFHPLNPNLIIGSIRNQNYTEISENQEDDESDDEEEEQEISEEEEKSEEEEEIEEKVTPKKKKENKNKTKKNAKQKVANKIYDLIVSEDGGQSWKTINQGILSYNWGYQCNCSLQKIPENRIIVIKRTYFQGTTQSRMEVSDDFFKSIYFMKNHISKFDVMKNLIYASEIIDHQTKEITIYASVQKKDLQFHPILMPQTTLKSHNYEIMDSGIYGVFIFVQHESTPPSGNLYKSDQNGIYFSLSISKIAYKDADPQVKFVDGSVGVILANTYSKGDKKSKVEMLTHISYNLGGTWSPIAPPSKYVDQTDTSCKGKKKCYLHFNSLKDIVSTQNAVGIILAYGNTGKSIDSSSASKSTFISRNSGHDWEHVSYDAKRIAIGDHGSIIVAMNSTNFQYSWSEGNKWDSLDTSKISTKLSSIDNLQSYQNSTSLKFLATSSVENKKLNISVIDFETQGKPKCGGIDDLESDDSDYEYWFPFESIDDEECVLGQKISYIRRRQDKECVNGEDFERTQKIKNCTCAEVDFECDYGFKMNSESGLCVKDASTSQIDNSECAFGASEYRISLGYRKIAGDTCVGGVAHEYKLGQCTKFSAVNLQIAGIAFVLLLICIGIWKRKCLIEKLCSLCNKKDGQYSHPSDNKPPQKKEEKSKQSKKLDLIYNDEELNINDDESKDAK